MDIDIWEYFNYTIGFFVKFVKNEYCLWNFMALKTPHKNTCYSLSRFESGLHTLKTKIVME